MRLIEKIKKNFKRAINKLSRMFFYKVKASVNSLFDLLITIAVTTTCLAVSYMYVFPFIYSTIAVMKISSFEGIEGNTSGLFYSLKCQKVDHEPITTLTINKTAPTAFKNWLIKNLEKSGFKVEKTTENQNQESQSENKDTNYTIKRSFALYD